MGRGVAARVSGLAAGMLVVSASVSGAVTNIGPFVGGATETFEGFSPGDVGTFASGTTTTEPIFGGLGLLSGQTTHTSNPLYIWNSTGGLSLGTYGTAVPHDGLQGLVLEPYGATHTVRIDFPTPVQDFGGYWAHASYQGNAGPVDWTFYDAGGGVIGTDSHHYPGTTLGGVLEWRGWTSTTPIAAVEYTGYWATADGLQINVPAPGAGVGLLGLIGLGAVRRRR